MDWDRDNVTGKAKATHKKSKMRNSFIISCGQAGVVSSRGKPGLVSSDGNLGRQTPSFGVFLFFPQLYMLHVMPYAKEYIWNQLGSAVPAVSPPSFLWTPSLPTDGVGWGAGKTWTLCKHWSAVTKIALCFQGKLFSRKIQEKSKPQPHSGSCEEN